jgi:hypothetical protein
VPPALFFVVGDAGLSYPRSRRLCIELNAVVDDEGDSPARPHVLLALATRRRSQASTARLYDSESSTSRSLRSISRGSPNSKPVIIFTTVMSISVGRRGSRSGRCESGGPVYPRCIHGWLITSVSVARRPGVVTSIRERRCLHSGPVVSGYERKEGRVRWFRRTCTQPNWVIDNASLNFRVQGGHVLIVKGDLTTDEDVEDDAKGPDIDLGPRVHLGVEQLGSGKVE